MVIACFDVFLLQVLTGETPFSDVQPPALAYHLLRGKRPEKPENALAIGFSDSLWAFTRRCWDGDTEPRPKAREVAIHLKEAAAGWDELMPPCSQVERVASRPEETSDLKKYGVFEVLILP